MVYHSYSFHILRLQAVSFHFTPLVLDLGLIPNHIRGRAQDLDQDPGHHGPEQGPVPDQDPRAQ